MTDTPSSHKPPIDHRDVKSIPARSPYPPPYNDAFHPGMQLISDEKGPRFLHKDGTPYPEDQQPRWGPPKKES